MVIIGIQHITNSFCQILLLHRLVVIPLVKGLQAEGIDRLGIPNPQGVDHIVAITYNRQIIGHSQHGLIALLHKLLMAVFMSYADITSEFDFC